MKKSMSLKKLKDYYCAKKDLGTNSCVFIFDGETLKDDDTAYKLDMENGDEISVFVKQIGGGI